MKIHQNNFVYEEKPYLMELFWWFIWHGHILDPIINTAKQQAQEYLGNKWTNELFNSPTATTRCCSYKENFFEYVLIKIIL